MKEAKTLTISFLVAIFIFSCTPKTISGTYSSSPPTPTFQRHSLILLYLYNDSTFRYIELKGACWYNTEYESFGKWTTYNSIVILNSNKLASDTMKLFSSKEVKYKQFTNYSLIVKRKKLIDTSQTNIGLRTLRKTSSETKIRAVCGNE